MMDTSEKMFEQACKVMPGGVNSPVRAYRAVGMTPRFIRGAKGAYITDVDGVEYIDYVGSWGPMILGHAHPKVLDAVAEVRAAVRSPDWNPGWQSWWFPWYPILRWYAWSIPAPRPS